MVEFDSTGPSLYHVENSKGPVWKSLHFSFRSRLQHMVSSISGEDNHNEQTSLHPHLQYTKLFHVIRPGVCYMSSFTTLKIWKPFFVHNQIKMHAWLLEILLKRGKGAIKIRWSKWLKKHVLTFSYLVMRREWRHHQSCLLPFVVYPENGRGTLLPLPDFPEGGRL